MKKLLLVFTLIIPLLATSQITQYTAFRIWAIDSFRLGDRWIRKISTNLNSPDSNSHNMVATNRAIMDMIRSGGGGTITSGSEGIRKNGATLELGDIAGQANTTLTVDRYLRSGNKSIYLQGNKTDAGVANLIFDDTLTASAGNPRGKYWQQFNSLDHTAAPYYITTANTFDGAGLNHTFGLGFNLSPFNTRVNSNYCALGTSIEGNFQGLQEWHGVWVDRLGMQRRIFSYTIDTTTKDIDFYHTVSRFYLKESISGSEYARLERTGSASQLTLPGPSTTLSLQSGTGLASLSMSPTVSEFHLNGMTNWFFPGMDYANGFFHVYNGINLNGTPTVSNDVNTIFGANTATTITMVAGSNPTISADNGPFIGMRGNTYSANSGERGILFIGAGNPSSPTGVEGELRFFTGATQVRMRIKPDGTTLFSSLAGSGTRMVTADASGNLGTSAIAATLYSGDGTLAGNRTVTGSNNDLTFASIDQFSINSTFSVQRKNDGTVPFTSLITGADNHWQFGYTPTAGNFDKGAAVTVDSNNNVSLGTTFIPSGAPLYAIGGSTYFNGIQSAQGNFYRISNVTTNVTASYQDYFFAIDATAGNITITLPAASTMFGSGVGIQYVFKRIDNSGNTVSIARAGSDTIDGGTSISLTTQYEVKELICGSTSAWFVK